MIYQKLSQKKIWINSRWTLLVMIWTQFLFNWLSLHNTSLCLGCPSGVWRFLHCRRANMLSRSLGRDFRSLVNSIHTTAFPQLDHPCQSLVASGHIGHTISSHPCGINSETPLVTVSSGKCLVSPKPWNHSTLSQPLFLSRAVPGNFHRRLLVSLWWSLATSDPFST